MALSPELPWCPSSQTSPSLGEPRRRESQAPVCPAGEFVISPVEGELRVRKDAELDRENIPFYNLTIAARDRGVPPLSSTVSPHGTGAGDCHPPCPVPCLCFVLLPSASLSLALGLSILGRAGEARLLPGERKERMAGVEMSSMCLPCLSPR